MDAKFEKETLTKITELRASVLKGTPSELATVDKESHALLGTLIATAEAYPDLKTSNTVTSLMSSVKEIEEEIARQRYTYNNVVQQFNTMLDILPSSFIGRMMGLLKSHLPPVRGGHRTAPEDRVLGRPEAAIHDRDPDILPPSW